MKTTLAKIEKLGKNSMVKNYAERIRTEQIDDLLRNIQVDNGDEDVVRRGVDEAPPEEEDPFYDPFDEIVRNSTKRPSEEPSSMEPKEKVTITDEQRKRMEESRARALAKKAEREARQAKGL